MSANGQQPAALDLGDLRFAGTGVLASGRVVDSEGEPVAGAVVESVRPTKHVSTGWTGDPEVLAATTDATTYPNTRAAPRRLASRAASGPDAAITSGENTSAASSGGSMAVM